MKKVLEVKDTQKVLNFLCLKFLNKISFIT